MCRLATRIGLAAAVALAALPAIAAETADKPPPCPCTYTLTQDQRDALVRALQAAQQFYGIAAYQTQALWDALAEQQQARATDEKKARAAQQESTNPERKMEPSQSMPLPAPYKEPVSP